MYIREYPDFGDTNLVCTPVVRSDDGVNIFSGQCAKGSFQIKSLSATNRYLTSLENSLMLPEITRHRTGTCSLRTQTSFFKKAFVSFFKRSMVHTMVTRTHVL